VFRLGQTIHSFVPGRACPGLSRPSTSRGTRLAGFRGCPAQEPSSGRAERGPVGRARTIGIGAGLHHLNVSELAIESENIQTDSIAVSAAAYIWPVIG